MPLWNWTAAPTSRTRWIRCCSAAIPPAPMPPPAWLKPRRTVLYIWRISRPFRRNCSLRFCSLSAVKSGAMVPASLPRRRCVWWHPAMPTCPLCCRRGCSAVICTTRSTSFRWRCRRCGHAGRIFCPGPVSYTHLPVRSGQHPPRSHQPARRHQHGCRGRVRPL